MSDTMDLNGLTESYDHFNIVIVGDPGVGRTSLLKKFLGCKFSSNNPSGIHVDTKLEVADYNRKAFTLKFWSSNSRYSSLFPRATCSFHGIIIVYDCTNYYSFDSVERWIKRIKTQFSDTVSKVLVGNKCDLHSRREVDYTIAKEYADQLQIPFMETSALNSTGLKNALKIMLTDICVKERMRVEQEREREATEWQEIKQQETEWEEKERRAKEWQERIRRKRKRSRAKMLHEKKQKYMVDLLIPFLETYSKNAVSVEQLSLKVATEMETQVDETSTSNEKETDGLRELEKFVCEGTMEDISKRWKKWRKAFELYLTARDITDDERKKATLLHCAGADLQDIYFSLIEENENVEAVGPSQSAETIEYEKAMNLIDNYFSLDKNPLYERLVFRTMQPKSKETVAQYAIRLKRQALYCGFGKMLEELVRDQIIETCRSTKMIERFLKEGEKLTLGRLIEISELTEVVDGEQSAEEMESAVQDTSELSIRDCKYEENRECYTDEDSNEN